MKSRTPKMSHLVFNAIKNLRDQRGSSMKDILNYIMSDYKGNTNVVKKQAVAALKRGIDHGYITRYNGHYCLNDEAWNLENPIGDCGTGKMKSKRKSRCPSKKRKSLCRLMHRKKSKSCGKKHRQKSHKRSSSRRSKHGRSKSKKSRSRKSRKSKTCRSRHSRKNKFSQKKKSKCNSMKKVRSRSNLSLPEDEILRLNSLTMDEFVEETDGKLDMRRSSSKPTKRGASMSASYKSSKSGSD